MNYKAVIYCRVSTDEEVQLSALASQVVEAREAVEKQGWILVDEYVDEGKTGTTAKHRDEYNRLVSDMEFDKYDIIVIKSQDRLMRNTKEWYVFVDKLVNNKKKLFFYLDNKFYSPDDALLTGIKAILAEEYSRDLSKKIKNAHKFRQQKGEHIILTAKTWGYDKDGKDIIINPKEAEMVRIIYDECIKGNGSRLIAKELESRGYIGRNGTPIPEVTIRKILHNPLYYGTAVMNQKRKNFDTKKMEHTDKSEWVYCENAVEPIVSKEVWDKAQLSMCGRTKKYDNKESHLGVYKGKNKLSGKIICGSCGSVYYRRHDTNNKGKHTIGWSCKSYLARGRKTENDRTRDINRAGGCDSPHIKEDQLLEVLSQIGSQMMSSDNPKAINDAIAIAKEAVTMSSGISIEDMHKELDNINNQRKKMLDMFLEDKIAQDIYESKSNELDNKKKEIELKISKDQYVSEDKLRRLITIEKEITDTSKDNININSLIEQIENITIYPDHMIVNFSIFPPVTVEIKRINYRNVEYNIV